MFLIVSAVAGSREEMSQVPGTIEWAEPCATSKSVGKISSTWSDEGNIRQINKVRKVAECYVTKARVQNRE
jgi:hypothetical protein